MARDIAHICSLLVVIVILSYHVSAITYNFEEEQSNGSYVGNVASDSGILSRARQPGTQELRFTIIPQRNPNADLFSLDAVSGILTSSVRIDRESICQHLLLCRIPLRVSALGSIFEVILVDVDIVDTNDNYPQFTRTSITLNIPEGLRAGVKFPIPSAIDGDIGDNGIQEYSLEMGTQSRGRFQLDSVRRSDGTFNVQIVVIHPLDREQSAFYVLTVVARDNGLIPKSGRMIVNINVTDTNDHAPEFTKRIYHVSVPENRPVGELLVQVKAHDNDTGVNGHIGYSFAAQTLQSVLDALSLDRSTGDITLLKRLDYEASASFQFIVEARDSGTQPQTARAVVAVMVTDINDNAPLITFNVPNSVNVANVVETAEIGKFIVHLTVYDDDSGQDGEVSCFIDNTMFILQRVLGDDFKLLLNTSLDRETEHSYKVNVTCNDGGSPSKVSSNILIINVTDVNDKHPRFPDSEYPCTVTENTDTNHVIITLLASDGDSGVNGELTYFLETKARDSFTIDQKLGAIRAKAPLDREENEQRKFLVFAKDSGMPSYTGSTTVIVTILDQNDNEPVFRGIPYEFSVNEDDAPGAVVGQVRASDSDLGQNSNVLYSLLPQIDGHNSFFSVSSQDGILQVAKPLDRESAASHTVVIVAADRGDPPLSSTTSVTILVTDINDHTPEIMLPNNGTVTITTIFPVGGLIATVYATDADIGPNALLTYSIDDPEDAEMFTIDASRGEIKLKKDLSSVTQIAVYRVQVTVRDGGMPQQHSQDVLQVTVEIGDPNALTGGTHSNMVIIIILVVVSAVISLVLVSVICIIYRRGKRHSNDPKLETGYRDGKSRSLYKSNSPVVSNGSMSPALNNSLEKLYCQRPPQQETLGSRPTHEQSNVVMSSVLGTYDGITPPNGVLAFENGAPFLILNKGLVQETESYSTGDSGRGGSLENLQTVDQHPMNGAVIRELSNSSLEEESIVSSRQGGITEGPTKKLQFVLDPSHEIRRSMRQLAPLLYGNRNERFGINSKPSAPRDISRKDTSYPAMKTNTPRGMSDMRESQT